MTIVPTEASLTRKMHTCLSMKVKTPAEVADEGDGDGVRGPRLPEEGGPKEDLYRKTNEGAFARAVSHVIVGVASCRAFWL